MSKIRLLYDHFLALGGAEKVSFELADRLNDCQVETAWADESLFAGQLNTQQLKSFGHDYLSHFFPSLSLLWFYLVNYKVDSSYRVLATGVFSPLVLWRNKNLKRAVVYFHTFPSFINETFSQLRQAHGVVGALIFKCFSVVYLWFLRRALKNADHVFANSNSVQQRFAAIGIDTQVLYPGVELRNLGCLACEPYFLSTARLESNKRIELVLQAFAELKEHKLVVVGGGSLEAQLKQHFADCDNIEFTGWQQEAQVKHHYNHCRALIYLPINEYFGIAPVEAMAAGKPVIGVAEGGLLETVNDKRLGTLLPTPVDIEQVKQTIVEYAELSNNQELIDYRQQSAKRFEFSGFAQKLGKVLKG